MNNINLLNKKTKRDEKIKTEKPVQNKISKIKNDKIINNDDNDIKQINENDINEINEENTNITNEDNNENDENEEKEINNENNNENVDNNNEEEENNDNNDDDDDDIGDDDDYIPSGDESPKNKRRNIGGNKSNKNNILNEVKRRVIKANNKILNNQESLVNELLCRWWYALPQWPPEDYDISNKLRENNLRLVNTQDWKKEPKIDEKGFEKCIQLPGFKYVMLDINGKTYDFRPQEGKPTYTNFMKMPKKKLCGYLLKALKNQLGELNKRKIVSEQELRNNIKKKLDQVQGIYNRL